VPWFQHSDSEPRCSILHVGLAIRLKVVESISEAERISTQGQNEPDEVLHILSSLFTFREDLPRKVHSELFTIALSAIAQTKPPGSGNVLAC